MNNEMNEKMGEVSRLGEENTKLKEESKNK